MELSKHEVKLLEAARRARPVSRSLRLVAWVSYLLVVVGIVAKVTGDFSRDGVLTGFFVFISFSMVLAYARFQNQALVLINKLTTGADAIESIGVHS